MLVGLLAGCRDSDDYNPEQFYPSLSARYLRVSQKTFNCSSASATTKNFAVSSIETPWAFSNVMDWVTVSSMSGTQSADIRLNISENKSGDHERLGVFYLESMAKDWDYNIPMSVYQPAATAYATPSKTKETFTGAIFSQDITVSSNCAWVCSSDKEWLTVVKAGDGASLNVSAGENLTNSSRSATVKISFNGKQLSTISITQKAANVTLETTTLTFENTAGAYEVKLTSEAAWTATTSQSWIEVSPASGNAGSSTLVIAAIENTSISERTGYVYINIGGKKVVEIPIRQRGLYIEFAETSLRFIPEEQEQKIRINSNTSWVIESHPEWMSITPMSGANSQDITIRVLDNPNVGARTTTIVATQAGLDLSSSLDITQSGKSFDYGSSLIECSDKAQEISVNITTTGYWTAKSNDSWIDVTPSAMSGSSSLTIAVTENGEDDSRTGTITLTIGDQAFTITIVQAGKYFTIDCENTTFGSTGANLSIEVSTNDSWTAKVENNASWITLSQTSGSGNASFVATIADNPSVNKRTANIVLTTAHNKSIKIPITQSARYMNVDHQGVTFFAFGGTSEDITISTDGVYSISCSATWFSVQEKGNGVFNVTAQENNTKAVREGVITIALTDLKEGTYSIAMQVLQSADGASFIIIGYGDDKNWDLGANTDATLTVVGYGTDKNWDTSVSKPGLTVTITGYSDDKNWDSNSSSSGSVSYQGYSNDKNWDTQSSSSGSVTYQGFPSDQNWNN